MCNFLKFFDNFLKEIQEVDIVDKFMCTSKFFHVSPFVVVLISLIYVSKTSQISRFMMVFTFLIIYKHWLT